MANYTVGTMIREARERQGYSQEALSYGICTSSTLSRIETGIQMPGRRILESLTQRLGISDTIYNTYASLEELELYESGQQLMRSLANRDYRKAESLSVVLRKKIEKKANSGKKVKSRFNICMEEQYLLFAEALIEKRKGVSREKILKQMLEAVRMTIPDFDGFHIENHLLTFHEISIINSIACLYREAGEYLSSLKLLMELKEYMERHVTDGEEKAEKYPMLLHNIAKWVVMDGQFDEALKLCQTGIDCCIQYGKLNLFPLLLFYKACALAELGRMEMARDVFFQSAAVFEATNQDERAEKTKKFVRMRYHMNM